MQAIVFDGIDYRIPRGRAEIEQIYLQPNFPYCKQGTIHLSVPINGVTEFRCHVSAQNIIQKFFDKAHELKLMKSLVTFNGCHNEQPKRTFPPMPSPQMWGIAFRLNSPYNQWQKAPPEAEPEHLEFPSPGPTFWKDHPIVKLADEMGFSWGGRMHFPEPDLFMLCTNY